MTRLDAKRQTTEVKDMLDLARSNAAETKTLNEIVTAISSKMNIPVPVSPMLHLVHHRHHHLDLHQSLTVEKVTAEEVMVVTVISDSSKLDFYFQCAYVVEQDDNAIYEKNGMAEKQKRMKEWEGALDSLLRGGGNLYSVRDKPMPEAIIELRRGMIGLDAKKQTTEVEDMLDLARCNAAEMKTLKEIVTAISIKMNIPVPVSPHVAHGSPSPPLAPPPLISNRGGCNGGNDD
ncbi:hypothetical protein LOK49_LG01G01692 [Camellia lanceoleosa]|uniref:Uncharacterized protein n=1 Tax=Camellia lanceoleosa TaxID=1840588 RepID=A0ACC0J680_9ERIC|nr:hypothetical protein LOK49_LG01G01692 [Camellia lanceoleosa]